MTARGASARALPVGGIGHHGNGWLGIWCPVTTEGILFAYLFFSYFFTTVQNTDPWPPEGLPKLGLASINTVILLLSSITLAIGEYRLRVHRARFIPLLAALITFLLGAIFISVQLMEWHGKAFGPTDHEYGSLFFLITGFHMAHVIVGLLVLLALALWSGLGLFGERRHGA